MPASPAAPSGSVEVLLATWDGERFLDAQLDSLFRQIYPGFHDLGIRRLLERRNAHHPFGTPVASRRAICGCSVRIACCAATAAIPPASIA